MVVRLSSGAWQKAFPRCHAGDGIGVHDVRAQGFNCRVSDRS